MKLNIIYITAKDKAEAKMISKTLLEEKLIACANIVDNVDSMYWWEGKIEEATEALVIAKTKEPLVAELIHRVKQLHSYECPCVVALPLSDANKAYFNWILKSTK
jgi:periplasmic divalent cation tolerance protein